MVTYHVKQGKEADLEATLSQAWQIYRTEKLVFANPHTIVRANDDKHNVRYVEIFTWVSHSGPEHAPDAVKQLWSQEQSLCEARNGHGAIEGGEVDLVVGQ